MTSVSDVRSALGECWLKAPVGLFRTNKQGRILAVNEETARLLGYERPEDLVGRQVQDLYARPERREEILQALERRNSVRRLSALLRRADGSLTVCLVDIWRTGDPGDDFLIDGAIYWGETDFDVVRHLQEGLERHEALNRIMLELLRGTRADAVADRTVEFALETVRADACVLFREDGQEVVGRGAWRDAPLDWLEDWTGWELVREDLWGPTEEEVSGLDDWSRRTGFRALVVVAVDTELVGRVQLVVLNKAPRIWEDRTLRLLRTLTMHAASVLERHWVEERLWKESELFESVIATVPTGILVLDENHRPVVVNRLARDYLALLAPGWPEQDVLDALGGLSFDEILSEDRRQVAVEGRIFELRHSPMPQALPGGFVLVIRDLTEEIAMRDRAETQERLAAVGRLAAGIAHDFNNILTTVLGYSELSLQDPSLPNEVRENLRTIMDEAQKGARLVRQVLDYGRRSLLTPRPTDLEALLADLLTVWRRTVPESVRLSLEVDESGRPYVAEVDPSGIQQVLTNLVINAVDAMEGRGQCLVRLWRQSVDDQSEAGPATGTWVVVSVEDSGPGIPESIRRKIFEPFFSTKPVGTGTGLGLSQAYGIVQQHGGVIEAGRSQRLGGAALQVYLRPAAEGVSPVAEEGVAEPVMPLGRGERILLVEDDPAALEAARRLLERSGFRVVAVADPEEAVRIYRERCGEIDIVVTDVVMPGMCGPDMVQKMAEVDPRVRAVLVSGYVEEFGRTRPLPERVFGYVAKPYSLESLAGTVRRALDAREGDEPLRS